MWVRSWIRSQSMYALSESSAERNRQAASGGRLRPQLRGRGAADAAEALRLAVAEDGAEVVLGGRLGGGEGLGEEHRALGVIARGAVDEGDRQELGVVESRALELVDPLRPRDADDQRLEADVARGVLLVHRKHAQVLDPVAALELGAEGLGRADEVRLRIAAVGPGAQVGGQRLDVGALVRKARRQGLGRVGDRRDEALERRPGHGPRCRPTRRATGSGAAPRRRRAAAARRGRRPRATRARLRGRRTTAPQPSRRGCATASA